MHYAYIQHNHCSFFIIAKIFSFAETYRVQIGRTSYLFTLRLLWRLPHPTVPHYFESLHHTQH